MFPLSTQTAIIGICRPVIAAVNIYARTTCVDHRLDGENHARYEYHTGFALAYECYKRVFVELHAYTVPAKFGDNAITAFVCQLANLSTYITQMCPRLTCFDSLQQTLFGDGY